MPDSQKAISSLIESGDKVQPTKFFGFLALFEYSSTILRCQIFRVNNVKPEHVTTKSVQTKHNLIQPFLNHWAKTNSTGTVYSREVYILWMISTMIFKWYYNVGLSTNNKKFLTAALTVYTDCYLFMWLWFCLLFAHVLHTWIFKGYRLPDQEFLFFTW